MKTSYQDYIGVFDSGVGGISVLKALTRELPEEHFLFFGDSANAPYGEKSVEEVQQLSFAIAESLFGRGVKALVIACNTATSAAASALRERHPEIPIIGVEPAIKPAAEAFPHKKILVLATPVTLHLEKFHRLSERLAGKADFLSAPCPGLAERIEKGNLDAPEFQEFVSHLLSGYRGKADAVVLGCTHYPFVKKQIRKVLGDLPMYDGAKGTARELKRVLTSADLLAQTGQEGKVVFASSIDTEKELSLYRKFYEMPID